MQRNELTWERRQRLLVNVILTRLPIRLQTQSHREKWAETSADQNIPNKCYFTLAFDCFCLLYRGRTDVHAPHQCGTWTGPHVNQSSRRRLFSREIIIVGNIGRWRRLFILFLPRWAIKWSHSGEKEDYIKLWKMTTYYGHQNWNVELVTLYLPVMWRDQFGGIL